MSSKSLSMNHVLIVMVVIWLSAIMGSYGETTTSPVSTTTPDPKIECRKHNDSCGDCVSNTACYYCFRSKSCDHYPYDTLKPYKECGDSPKDMAWKTCLVSFKTLIIVLTSVGVSVVVISVICCCCLCKKCRSAQLRRQIDRWDQKRMDMKAKHEERRQEREQRRQELRDKYGIGSNNNPYSRF